MIIKKQVGWGKNWHGKRMNPLELAHSLVILIRDPQTNSLIKCYRKWKRNKSKPIENCMKIENRKSARNNLLAYLLTMRRMKRKWIYDKQEKEGGQGNEWKITKWRKKQHFNAFIFFFAYSHHRLAIPIMVFMIHH